MREGRGLRCSAALPRADWPSVHSDSEMGTSEPPARGEMASDAESKQPDRARRDRLISRSPAIDGGLAKLAARSRGIWVSAIPREPVPPATVRARGLPIPELGQAVPSVPDTSREEFCLAYQAPETTTDMGTGYCSVDGLYAGDSLLGGGGEGHL